MSADGAWIVALTGPTASFSGSGPSRTTVPPEATADASGPCAGRGWQPTARRGNAPTRCGQETDDLPPT
jgi:hypothetical protein